MGIKADGLAPTIDARHGVGILPAIKSLLLVLAVVLVLATWLKI